MLVALISHDTATYTQLMSELDNIYKVVYLEPCAQISGCQVLSHFENKTNK